MNGMKKNGMQTMESIHLHSCAMIWAEMVHALASEDSNNNQNNLK